MKSGKSDDEAPKDLPGDSLEPGTLRSGTTDVSGGRSSSADQAATPQEAPLADAGYRRIARLARAAERRMRLATALEYGTTTLAMALFGAAVTLACAKTNVLTDPAARRVLFGLGASPILAAAAGWLRRLPPMAGAIALDREAGLRDRIATALSFGVMTSPSPFQRAAIADGIENAGKVSPRRAVRIPMPRDVIAVLAIGGVVGLVSILQTVKHTPIAHTPTINSMEVDNDSLEAMQDFGRQAADQAKTPEMQAAVQEFNQLIEELKNKKIDRDEAFKRMAELDTKLQSQGDVDKKALDEAMKKLGNELKKNDLTKDIGAALEKGDKKEAEKKLKELSEKIKNGKMKLSEQQKKDLAAALKAASQRDRDKAMADMKSKRDQVEADLEKIRAEKDKNGGKETPEMEKDRKDKERELERLDKEEQQQQSADRQLDRLDRDLASASEDIMKDLGLSAADLDSGAEDINKMAEDDMTDQEREELRQRLKELHDLLVQQGKLTPEQQAKLKDFLKKAKGQKSAKGGKKGKMGKPGEFDPNGDPSGDDQSDDDGKDGQDGKDGDGKDGKDGKGQKWTLGPGGEKIPVPGGAGQGGQQGGDQPGGKGDQPGGSSWGTGHDPNLLGKKTDPKMGTQDLQIVGQNAGDGPKRSDVILGAADKGFVGAGYKKVYDEYKTVAEQALKVDEIPAGYRFYVRRYFDLIRPRE